MIAKSPKHPKARSPTQSPQVPAAKSRSLGGRELETLHKGSDPAYPADEARASDPGREKPQE